MTINKTNFSFPGQTNFYRGKVRDVYTVGDLLIVIASDRVSAFDRILPKQIPFKGAVLNGIATTSLQMTQDIVPNWLISTPHPNVSIGKKCEPIRIEMVVRGYLAGHAWREYKKGNRTICGVALPEGLKENDKLPKPIITPTTKSLEGHDRDISKEEIYNSKLVPEDIYEIMENYTYSLFSAGSEIADNKGLILVDTKYEFGLYNGEVILIDEIHTPDSSRYFYKEGYEERQQLSQPQKQLSKEFLREWLLQEGFDGSENSTIPLMTDSIIQGVSERYIELYEKITGNRFVKNYSKNILEEIENSVLGELEII